MDRADPVGIPAIVTAGDARAAKAIYGESKVFLEVAGRPMVAHVVAALQRVPEISEVWVVGNRERLRPVLDAPELQAELTKPLFVVEQQRNLMENCWETFRRFLARDTEAGVDPVGEQLDQAILYLSGDMPFATPQEISAFIARSTESGCDYAVGLVPDTALEDFLPRASGEPGVEVAYFNLREGRLRQSNLHWSRPARIGNRFRIEEMYEHRHQREFWNMATLAWKLFWSRAGGPRIVFFYTVMHLAGVFDRWRLRSLSDWLRQYVSLPLNESVIERVLDTKFRFIITEGGGCAIDVDTEEEYEAVCARFDDWKKAQRARAEAIYGPIPLAATAGTSAPGGEV